MRTIFEGGFSFEGNPQSESIKSCKNIKPYTACNRRIFTVRNEVAKVMFLHMYVILFTGGGVLSQHALQVVSQHALQWGCLLPGVACSRGVPTVADGRHPTGMHSCLCTVITFTLNEK